MGGRGVVQQRGLILITIRILEGVFVTSQRGVPTGPPMADLSHTRRGLSFVVGVRLRCLLVMWVPWVLWVLLRRGAPT